MRASGMAEPVDRDSSGAGHPAERAGTVTSGTGKLRARPSGRASRCAARSRPGGLGAPGTWYATPTGLRYRR